jgi:AbrB family looped-hinge helix DNA binding protein
MTTNTVRISPTFQIVIPEDLRELLRLRPGQRLHAIPIGSRIELIPVRELQDMRGFLRGIATDVPRGDDRP